uniref:Ribonuclease E n=1 Tax=Hildenbrandia rubra TaxID=31481 RepID=A0A1C9CG45_9FLOR|nr:ribonuclease E [Hildenbrandia rubra]AOM67351.1 ribonuclease E [Hildenbrandia rubra]
MATKLIISSLYNTATVVCKNQIQEFIVVHNDYQVSDIYIGTINKIFQSINAAFVSLLSNKKSGFIHANDSNPLKRRANIGNVANIFTVNQRILVQIIKESTTRKGPKLTANITLSGQYITLMPFNHTTCIARSISNPQERYALKALAILLKPVEMGLLFHKCSSGISEKVLVEELEILKKQWNFIKRSVVYMMNPSLIYRNNNIIKKVLQDFCVPSVKSILIDSSGGLLKLKKYLQSNIHNSKYSEINFELLEESKCYKGNTGVFLKIMKSLRNCTQLHLGGYITIEMSEALTTIDVNSGSFNSTSNPRETALTTNCIAATEIGYQLRKRNITGIIIIDFIDMRRQQDQFHLLKHFSEVLQKDGTQPRVVQLSELGLVEIIRQRTNKNLRELYSEYLLPVYHQHYLTTKDNLRDSNLNYWLSVTTNQFDHTAILMRKNYENSIFFKKMFLAFYHIIYKRKSIDNVLTAAKYNQFLDISTIHLSTYSSNVTSTFLYKNVMNNSINI